MEAESGEARNSCRLVEHVQISESELLRDGLSNLEQGVLLLLVTLVVAELHGAGTDFALNTEHNVVWVSSDGDCLAQGEELLAYLGVLVGVNGHHGLVLGLRDGEMLTVDSDEVETELSCPLGLGVLKHDPEMSCLLLCGECNGVRVVSQLHDLGKVGDGDSQHHVAVSTVVLESVHAQVQGNESDVRAVHSL